MVARKKTTKKPVARKTRKTRTTKKPARKTVRKPARKTAVRKTRRTTTARKPARKPARRKPAKRTAAKRPVARKPARKPARKTTRRVGSKVTVRGVPASSQRFIIVDGSMRFQTSSRLLTGARKHVIALQKKHPKKLFRIVDTRG